MAMKLNILFTLIAALCFGCGSKTFTDLDEFERFIKSEDSPYVQTIVKNGVKLTLRYMPTDAMMINYYRRFIEKRKNLLHDTTLAANAQQSRLAELRKELQITRESYDRSLYFQLTIGYEDPNRDIVFASMAGGFGNYSQWLQKLLFGLQEKITLETALLDEVPLDTYHMERSYGMTKDRTLLLMFPEQFNGINLRDHANARLKLRIAEFGLSTGTVSFEMQPRSNRVELRI